MLGVSVMQQGRERCHAPLHDVRALAAELAALTRAAELSSLGRDDLKEKMGKQGETKSIGSPKKGGEKKRKRHQSADGVVHHRKNAGESNRSQEYLGDHAWQETTDRAVVVVTVRGDVRDWAHLCHPVPERYKTKYKE